MKRKLQAWLQIKVANAILDAENERQRLDLIKRLDALEEAFATEQSAHAQEIAELRERLDMPKVRKPSGRPFHVLRSLAEAGARRDLNAG